jgi:spore maturation protein CgeB
VRILIVDTCYPAFLRHHYGAREGLATAPYRQQWRALMDTFFGTADAYSYNLNRLGHEAHEFVVNCAPLQHAWAREHHVPLGAKLRGRPSDSIVLAQAGEYRPDVIYVQNPRYLSSRTLRRLRGTGAAIVGQIGSRAPSRLRLRLFDLIVTSFPHFVGAFSRVGVPSAYLPIGFDERVLERLESERAPTSTEAAVFVGALNRSQHWGANALLERAAARAPIDFWGYLARGWRAGWPAGSPMVTRYRGEAWGIEMYRVLRAARIAVNRHGAIAGKYANNMRLYEATGVGAMLLTEAKENLGELFESGVEVETYATEDELVEKTNYYLQHEEERRAIAAAGQARTLSDHTYARRMSELIDILRRELR